MPSAPADEYHVRLGARRQLHARLTRVDERFSYARLTLFGAAVVAAVGVWQGWLLAWWLIAPLVAFGVLVIKHDRIVRRRDAAGRAIAFYERGMARIEDRWAGSGETGERFRESAHLYAHDLDLFGPGSLFELLSIARTRAGEETLGSWLLAPADLDEVRLRQRAVDDLTPRLDLREALSLAGADVGASVHTDALVAWAEGPVILRQAWLRPVAALLSVAAIAAVVAWVVTGSSSAFVAVIMLEIAFTLPLREKTDKALHGADGPARDLSVLAVVLGHLEAERFTAERLSELQRHLDASGSHSTVAIRRLRRLVELHDWQHNLVFAPVGASVLWGTHLALAIEAWRRVHGRDVREWLRISGELEALASLSAYRYEHPDDPFPELVAVAGREAAFHGAGLGHPLLPATRMVRNDVSLGQAPGTGEPAPRLLIVSGSNMSGKSTLLRTVGINAVLAFAGAPVRARELRLAPLRIGATLRIQDSLQEGRSRFYAEISRVREIADLAAGPVPVLFLLDELFHGTNSHDRVLGASGVLRALLEREAIGLVTTHDLAMTAVADQLEGRAANVHFDDRFERGEITFDYVMKPGPVTRSNAIALMRAVGLDVPQE